MTPPRAAGGVGSVAADLALSLVVPLFNEEARLAEFGPALVEFVGALPVGSELIFVDDGSTDATRAVAEELIGSAGHTSVRLLPRQHAGKGAAVAAGLRAAGADYAGFCDVDLATPLHEMHRLLHVAARARVLAIGSRDLAASTLVRSEQWPREVLGRAYNRLLQATIVPGVLDTQCGAKVASKSVWEILLPLCHERGFAWDAELIGVAIASGVPVREVPVEWRHDARTRVRVVRDGLGMVFATGRLQQSVRRARELRRGPSRSDEVFDAANAELLAQTDHDHWWFRSKAAFVATALRRTGTKRAAAGFLLDVGAGGGGVTARLGWDADRLVVVEGNAALATHARVERGLLTTRALAGQVPVKDGSVAAVCLLDVIEHLADPVAALAEIRRTLAPDGRVVVSVPAHGWLWSPSDEQLGHFRRYNRRMLEAELRSAGLSPVVLTHVFSWLLPGVALERRLKNRNAAKLGLDRNSRLVSFVAMVLTRLECELIGRVTLPFGTSVLAVAGRDDIGRLS